ncbi:MAG TPA: helix-turn-helix domain-containing protein [Acidimicrobiales bacterium]
MSEATERTVAATPTPPPTAATATATAPDPTGGAGAATTTDAPTHPDNERRRELGEFLRSRRERLAPEAVGLPPGGRRRTPGLRREEVAMLAGISVDYLVRLEQGRETNPSNDVLAALARALRLDDDERLHLGLLGKLGQRHPALCPSKEEAELPETILAMLDGMARQPAFVMDDATEIEAWNTAYERLMGPTGVLDSRPPNLMRYTFLDERSRALYADWEAIAREQVGNLRQAAFACTEDPTLIEMVGELSMKSPDFARLWAEHEVSQKTRGEKHLVHPVVGDLRLRFEVLLIPDNLGRRIVVYSPVDATSAEGLDRLLDAARAPLRLVGGGTAG